MKYNDNGTVKEIVVKAGDTLPIGTIVEYEGTTIPDGYTVVEDEIGDIQILNIQTKILAADDIPSGGNIQKSDTFIAIEGADGYIAIQQNNNWLIPTGITISGNTLSAILLNPFASTKTGNCSFVILAYKNRR